MTDRLRLTCRAGVTLVELLVAMVVLSVVMTSVASLTFVAARDSIVVAGQAYRQGVMVEEINGLTSLPYASLPGVAGCRTVSTGVFPHTTCVSGTASGQYGWQVEIVVTPAQPGVRPDTVVFVRANPPVVNPLNM